MTSSFTLDTAFRHHREGRLHEAEALYRQVLAVQPADPDALHLLGVLLHQKGDHPAGADLIRRAIQIKSDNPDFHNNLGAALMPVGRTGEAAAAFQKAIQLRPDYPDALNNLGNVLKDMGSLDEAVASYRRALSLRPDYADAWSNLANAMKLMGHLDEAIQCYRRSLSLRPNPVTASNLVYLLHFHPDFTARQIYQEHAAWDQTYARPLAASITPHSNDRSTDRRLRVGYVSPDFRAHPIGRFLLQLITYHDHKNFEIFCYSDVWQSDAVTAALQSHADVWRQTTGMPDANLADMIRQDRIDLLVDLTMHMQNNRMLTFARKPAPVQVTYLAYCSTTGLSTMDYRLSDTYLDPLDTDESVYTEETVRLPISYWCYAPVDAPLVREPPGSASGRITFGCMNNFAKVTPRTLETWCRLLAAVPESDLLLYAHEGAHRQETRDTLARHGVDPRRLRFVPMLPLAQYFEQYHQIDIALDSFPYPGGTTTCDALWMGVPVVSLAGQTAVSRAGLSILSNVGLPELVAHTADQYIKIALELASNPARLAQLRQSLRQRMLASPIMDGPRFARDVEAAYRSMWQAWCGSPSPKTEDQSPH